MPLELLDSHRALVGRKRRELLQKYLGSKIALLWKREWSGENFRITPRFLSWDSVWTVMSFSGIGIFKRSADLAKGSYMCYVKF